MVVAKVSDKLVDLGVDANCPTRLSSSEKCLSDLLSCLLIRSAEICVCHDGSDSWRSMVDVDSDAQVKLHTAAYLHTHTHTPGTW
jgi:hypothetical protein